MPYIKIMNLDKEQVAMVAKNTVSDISKIIGVKESLIHFFHCGDALFVNDLDAMVYIEIVWYSRNATQMQSIAKLFYDEIKKHKNYDVHVVYQDLSSTLNHYANGEQYKRPH